MALGCIQGQIVALIRQAPPAATAMPYLRIVVRIVIAALIAVLLAYIVIEQVGTWRRRRSARG